MSSLESGYTNTEKRGPLSVTRRGLDGHPQAREGGGRGLLEASMSGGGKLVRCREETGTSAWVRGGEGENREKTSEVKAIRQNPSVYSLHRSSAPLGIDQAGS